MKFLCKKSKLHIAKFEILVYNIFIMGKNGIYVSSCDVFDIVTPRFPKIL